MATGAPNRAACCSLFAYGAKTALRCSTYFLAGILVDFNIQSILRALKFETGVFSLREIPNESHLLFKIATNTH